MHSSYVHITKGHKSICISRRNLNPEELEMKGPPVVLLAEDKLLVVLAAYEISDREE